MIELQLTALLLAPLLAACCWPHSVRAAGRRS